MAEASQEQIHRDRVVHQNPYRHVTGDGEFQALLPEGHPAVDVPLHLNSTQLRGGKSLDAEFSREEIEEIARKLQNKLWKNRNEIWEEDVPEDPIDVLDPSLALETVGYVCVRATSLGRIDDGNGGLKVAATIEDQRHRVEISGDFPVEVLRFTTAHELGHALLHEANGLHRDLPVKKARSNDNRDQKEIEADKFATFFLMPAKRVKKHFANRFGKGPLQLDQNTAYGLQPGTDGKLLSESESLRKFARVVAKSDRYHDDHFYSLSERFGVSVETMAIRLEELDLVRL